MDNPRNRFTSEIVANCQRNNTKVKTDNHLMKASWNDRHDHEFGEVMTYESERLTENESRRVANLKDCVDLIRPISIHCSKSPV